ncbi:hypothetical protein [Streptomyces sp. NPDC048191]|uniref:hypothetical protein n=1 Tax=Streptomyces sp. NPDC048191 TaxID=3155484 RepID=UPI0033E9AC8B
MMKKLLATAALTVSAAALAAPAHAAAPAVGDSYTEGGWTLTDTAACATDIVVIPLVNAVAPVPLSDTAVPCRDGSLIHQGLQGARQTSV